MSWNNKGYPIEIVCHRGANEFAPENTYASAQLCIDWGMDYVEIDVNRSRDGRLYLFHGPELERTTNGVGRFDEWNAEAIDRLDVGSWFHPKYAGERAPRLEPFLQWIKGKAKLFIDVKGGHPQEIIDAVRAAGMAQECFFWCGDDEWARRFRRLAPDMQLKINIQDAAGVWAAHERFRANIVEVDPPNMNQKILDACRSLGVKTMIYAKGKDPALYRRVLEWGVEMVNLNHGDLFVRVAEEFYQGRTYEFTK
jgi:glycerophosphoryl diester phosphodiesterase